LNASWAARDQLQPLPGGCNQYGGSDSVTIIRPDNDAPIPLRSSSPPIGTIVLRFVGLLLVMVTLLVLAWSR
jgi:hypothetical protein